MMGIGNGFVHLPEDRGGVNLRRHVRVDRCVERELGTRQKANGSVAIVRRAETASAGAEVARDELFTDNGSPRLYELKAVITHGAILLMSPGLVDQTLWPRF